MSLICFLLLHKYLIKAIIMTENTICRNMIIKFLIKSRKYRLNTSLEVTTLFCYDVKPEVYKCVVTDKEVLNNLDHLNVT